jgi:hypothetical protein
MTTSPDLYAQHKTLEEATRLAGRSAIVDINPLTEAEALETELRLIYIDGPIAVFWSKELSRPAFFISEGECEDDDDDDECTTQIQVNQFLGDILTELRYRSSILKTLVDLTQSKQLQEYVELLVESKNAEAAYRQSQWEVRDKQEYDRLRQKFEPPAS